MISFEHPRRRDTYGRLVHFLHLFVAEQGLLQCGFRQMMFV